MNRLQNVVLAIWVVLLLLFVAFNWQMAWRPVEVVFLFTSFNVPVILWLVLGGVAAAALLRILAELDVRTRRRRTDKEIHAIKAKAFDGLTGEFDKMVSKLQDQLGERIQSMLGEQPPKTDDDPGAPPPAQPASASNDGEDEDERNDKEAPPRLSAETAATLAELKAEPKPDEAEDGERNAKEKPKRGRRKSK